jgi:MFS family permease
MNKEKLYNRLGKIYDRINNEEDARVCTDIPDEACKYIPQNYFLIIISNTLTKLGDVLSNPKTVLAWLMSYVNAPLYLISFIVPIRESGSMLPQIVIASYIRRVGIRKWIWVAGSVLQFFFIAGIGLVALHFKGETAGWLIILLLIAFSLSRGLSSVASKDVLGKTIPKKRRGRLKGYATFFSGILVVLAGLYMITKSNGDSGVEFYSNILFFAAGLWILAAIVYSGINEYSGETAGGGNALKEAIARLNILRKDKPFRNFVISRALLLCSALTAPFYVVLAQNQLGTDISILGMFIIANGIASSISAPLWGKMADSSSKGVMVKGAIITSALGIFVFIAASWIPFLRTSNWFYPVAFFILGIAHSGVRLGRKTYVVDLAGGNKRTDYVAVSNTVIGVILLITGGISALASMISTKGIILVLSLFGIAGAITSSKLPNVEE